MLRKKAEAEKAKKVAAEEGESKKRAEAQKASKQQLKILRARAMIF
jgi:hypothetical protein